MPLAVRCSACGKGHNAPARAAGRTNCPLLYHVGAGGGAIAVGVTLWLLFADVVVYHATGARLLGGAAHDETSTAPCPPASASATP